MNSKNAQPTPPKHLHVDTAVWFKQVVAEYDLESHPAPRRTSHRATGWRWAFNGLVIGIIYVLADIIF
jgi:hypothetical protein